MTCKNVYVVAEEMFLLCPQLEASLWISLPAPVQGRRDIFIPRRKCIWLFSPLRLCPGVYWDPDAMESNRRSRKVIHFQVKYWTVKACLHLVLINHGQDWDFSRGVSTGGPVLGLGGIPTVVAPRLPATCSLQEAQGPLLSCWASICCEGG